MSIAAAARLVRRRRAHFALACVVAGFAAAPFGTWPALAAALVAAVGAALALGDGGASGAEASPATRAAFADDRESGAAATAAMRAAVAAGVLVLGAAVIGSLRIAALDKPARAAPPGTAVAAQATVLEAPRPIRFGLAATLRIDRGPARGLRVYARGARGRWPPQAGPGLRVMLRGVIVDSSARRGAHDAAARGAVPAEANAGRPGTPGYGPLPQRPGSGDDFDFDAFLRSRGVGRRLEVEALRPLGRRGGVAGAVDAIRRRAESGIGAGLPPDRAALARGMVLGEDGQIPDDVRDDFRRSGLAHLLAASGQNVALMFALALPLLMFGGAGQRTRIAVLLALALLYVPLAGGGASVLRAGVMAVAALAALAAGRPASASYALLLAAVVTLGINPRASGDPGWRLSFAAVAGLLLLEPRVRRLVKKLPRQLATPLAASVAATVATAPVMAHDFGRISLAALPANVVALPAVAPVMWIGMIQAALAQATALGGTSANAALALCRTAATLNALPLRWVAWTARIFAQPDWAQASVHLSWLGMAAVYGGLATTLLLAPRLARAVRAAASRPRLLDALDRWRAMPPPMRRAAITLAATLIVAAGTALAASSPAPPRALTVDFLDVGQGDATLVRDPYGAAVLFDSGPPEARVDRLMHRLGVRRLSAVVATHQSRDHQGGLRAVVERLPVGLFLDGGDGTRDAGFVALEHAVDAHHIRRISARQGEVLRVGALTIRVLWPPRRARSAAPPADPNLAATVAVVSEGGFRLLLSADAESPVLLPLKLPHVDALKVPHHGSADPGLARVLERLRPRVAAIEVGRGNDYGHPRPSTLAALRAHVPYVYRTDRDGTTELAVSGGRIVVRTHR